MDIKIKNNQNCNKLNNFKNLEVLLLKKIVKQLKLKNEKQAGSNGSQYDSVVKI